eukprot:6455178-Amphidinium_carterae.1
MGDVGNFGTKATRGMHGEVLSEGCCEAYKETLTRQFVFDVLGLSSSRLQIQAGPKMMFP